MVQGRPSLRLRHSYSARCRVVGLMLGGLSPQAASTACGMSRATAYRLLRRYELFGWHGLRDRPPIAKSHPRRLSAEAEAQIVELRRRSSTHPDWSGRRVEAGACSGCFGASTGRTHTGRNDDAPTTRGRWTTADGLFALVPRYLL